MNEYDPDRDDDPETEDEYECTYCGFTVSNGTSHTALCGLPCEGGRLGLGDHPIHNMDCERCNFLAEEHDHDRY